MNNLSCIIRQIFLTVSGLVLFVRISGQHTLIYSLDYATNNNVVENINSAVRQPALSPSVSFLSKWGVDAVVMGNFIANSDDSLENFSVETDMTLGYNLKISKNFSIYPGYTRFIYSKSSNSFNRIFRNDFRIDADYRYRFTGLGLSSGFLTGQQHTFYALARNYYVFDFSKVIFREASLIIEPEIDVNFGDYEYLNLFYLDQIRQYPSYYDYMLLYSKDLRRYVFAEIMRHPGRTRQQIIDELLMERAQDSFKLTSLTLSLPISYTIGDFGINLSLFVFFPLNQPDYLTNDVLYYLDFGISYNLNL